MTMPGTLCLRCKVQDAVYFSRKEPFCKDCFVRFVRGKQRKLMADYKVSYDPATGSTNKAPKILLAMSCSESALALFEMLVSMLREQRKMHRGKSGFELTVVHVDLSTIYPYATSPASVMDDIKTRYADVCTVLNVPVNDFFDQADVLKQFSHLTTEEYSFIKTENAALTVSALLDGIQDRSAKLDMLETIRDRVIYRWAGNLECTTVLWGDTMTRIAEKTLSLTVKGKGSVVPYLLSDGFRNGVYNIMPLRDVLRAEAEEYVKLSGLSGLVTQPTRATPSILRMMTIDALLANYFAEIEKGFPSIVSTVVRTAAKLSDKVVYAKSACVICGNPCDDAVPEKWLQSITVSRAPPTDDAVEDGSDDKPGPTDKPLLCYGCLVTTKHTSFPWPLRPSKAEILDEYEIQ